MSDSDNNNNADHTHDPSTAAKPKVGRTSDIYERFLNRVQQIDSEIDDQPLPYEPLSEEELQLFPSSERAQDDAGLDFDFDFDNNFYGESSETDEADDNDVVGDESVTTSDSVDHEDHESADSIDKDSVKDTDISAEKVAATSAVIEVQEIAVPDIDGMNSAIENDRNTALSKTKKTEKAKKGGSKLLIIGAIIGLLVSVAVFIGLKSTGMLGEPTQSVETPAPESTKPVATEPATTDIVADEPPVAVSDSDNVATTNDAAPSEPQRLPVASDEPDISIEDFKEEAQNTLYRETQD